MPDPTDQDIFNEAMAPPPADKLDAKATDQPPATTGAGESPAGDAGSVEGRDALGRFTGKDRHQQPRERLEGQPAPTDKPPETAAKASEMSDAQIDQEIGRQAGGGPQQQRPPLSELIDERLRRQRAEDERDRAVSALQERDRREAAARREAEQRQAAERRQIPDLITDPDGFAEYVRQDTEARAGEVERAVQRRIVDMTFEEAREAAPQEFDAAFEALRNEVRDGDNRNRDRIVNAPNPGRALMRWHRDRAAMAEVGGDLKAYRERVLADAMKDPEFRKRFADELRGEAAGNGNGNGRGNVTELPSLNRTTGAGSAATEALRWESDRELFNNTVRRR